MNHHSLVNQLANTIRKKGFWFILALLLIISLPYYAQSLPHPAFVTSLISEIGLNRHAFERILYLIPIVWAGFIFGWGGAFITSLAALACMLPRAVYISLYPRDALMETSAVFIIGNVLAVGFSALRKEREYRLQLEVVHKELRASEEKYKDLFNNANDAIWLHDLDNNIIAANKACAVLTGYNMEELYNIRSGRLFTESSHDHISQLENSLIRDKATGCLIEAEMVRKDGSRAYVQLSTGPALNLDNIVGIQHIARDITEQKRLQENLRFYLQQVTMAQEEERKRISHELHDETMQDLIVLSRQLDALASNSKEMSKESHLPLENLCKQTDNILRGLRRLSQDLRPAALDRIGLLPALEQLASDMIEHTDMAIRVDVQGKERRLAEEVELMLFRITQEALRNAWRHSGADSARVTISFEESKTRITIADNGKGFNLPENMGDLARYGKLGLAGMHERAQQNGGKLEVLSKPGKGTVITIETGT